MWSLSCPASLPISVFASLATASPRGFALFLREPSPVPIARLPVGTRTAARSHMTFAAHCRIPRSAATRPAVCRIAFLSSRKMTHHM